MTDTRQRYVNLSALKADGTAISTQIWTNNPFDALDRLQEWVKRTDEAAIVAAVIYDTAGVSVRYDVNNGNIRVNGLEQVQS